MHFLADARRQPPGGTNTADARVPESFTNDTFVVPARQLHGKLVWQRPVPGKRWLNRGERWHPT